MVDDAIRFVSQKSKDQDNIKSPIEDDKESKEPGYDDVEQLELNYERLRLVICLDNMKEKS